MHSTLNLAVDKINIHECIMHQLDLVVVQRDMLSEYLMCISVKMQMFTQLCHHSVAVFLLISIRSPIKQAVCTLCMNNFMKNK